MSKVRVHNLSVSLDGYAAGPDQAFDSPLGVGGPRLHEWMFATAFGRRMMGEEGGSEGVDNEYAARAFEGIGATIMGRNMFGPIRGEWPDESWTGWWGAEPPYHHPVFVLTHHDRSPVEMTGGTTFHFVSDGIESALRQAVVAAKGEDVAIGGGAATVQQYLRAGLIDVMEYAIVPVFLGSGERLFDDLGDTPIGYEVDELVSSSSAAHVRLVTSR